jgi:hypothetical protein
MRSSHVVLILAVLAAPVSARAQLPPGYERVDSIVVLPDTLRETMLGGRFRISVTRAAHSADERRLIEIAESLIPPADVIESAAAKLTGAGWVKGFADARLRSGLRWWWREWDHIWLPFGLTGEAIAEYIANVRTLSTSPNPFAGNNPEAVHRASLEYTASVHHLSDSGGHRVELSARYQMYCGHLCALSFRHTRTVTFDRAGVVIRVEGDGPPMVIVS